MLSSAFCWLYFCVNLKVIIFEFGCCLLFVICVSLLERQDLLLCDNFTRQIEPGIGSFSILFIDNWVKTNHFFSSNIEREHLWSSVRVSVSIWNECCDPPLLPVATPSLQLQDPLECAARAAFNICIILPWVNMKLRFILAAMKAGSSSLPLHFISPASIPLHFTLVLLTVTLFVWNWLCSYWPTWIYFNKILSNEWHEERKHQGYFSFWTPIAAAVIRDVELEAAVDWLQTLEWHDSVRFVNGSISSILLWQHNFSNCHLVLRFNS